MLSFEFQEFFITVSVSSWCAAIVYPATAGTAVTDVRSLYSDKGTGACGPEWGFSCADILDMKLRSWTILGRTLQNVLTREYSNDIK